MTLQITEQTTVAIYPENLSPEQLYQRLNEAARLYKKQPEKQVEAFQKLLAQANLAAITQEAIKGDWPTNYCVSCLYQSRYISVVAIKMAENAEIPPHNHPGMIGVMRLLSGKVAITTFKPPTAKPVRFLERDRQFTVEAGGMGSLTPERGNYHQLIASEKSLFLDIFSPNYSIWRMPSNYRVTEQTDDVIIPVQKVNSKFKMVKRIISHKQLRFKRWLLTRLPSPLRSKS